MSTLNSRKWDGGILLKKCNCCLMSDTADSKHRSTQIFVVLRDKKTFSDYASAWLTSAGSRLTYEPLSNPGFAYTS